MQGKNTIVLNQATLCKAVQHWLATEVFRDGKCPKVTCVGRQDSRTMTSGIQDVCVELEERVIDEREEVTA